MKLLVNIAIVLMLIGYISFSSADLTEKLYGNWEGDIVGFRVVNGELISKKGMIELSINNGVYEWKVALTEYPYKECNGKLIILSETKGSAMFLQKAVDDECTTGKAQLIWMDYNKLKYIAYRMDGTVVGHGELQCQECNVNPDSAVFKKGMLHLPNVQVPDGFGGFYSYEADLSLVPSSNPMMFGLTYATRKQ